MNTVWEDMLLSFTRRSFLFDKLSSWERGGSWSWRGTGGKKGDFQTDTLDQLLPHLHQVLPYLPDFTTLHNIQFAPHFICAIFLKKRGDFQPDTLPAYLLPHLHQVAFSGKKTTLLCTLCSFWREKNTLFIIYYAACTELQVAGNWIWTTVHKEMQFWGSGKRKRCKFRKLRKKQYLADDDNRVW